jgi:hypothetical protein
MRTSVLIAILVAILSDASLAAHAADPFPKFDIAKNCKTEVSGNTGIGETLGSCTHDEEQARQQLIPVWDRYSRDNKTNCIRETSVDGSPSYVELQTCLEMFDEEKDKQ